LLKLKLVMPRARTGKAMRLAAGLELSGRDDALRVGSEVDDDEPGHTVDTPEDGHDAALTHG